MHDEQALDLFASVTGGEDFHSNLVGPSRSMSHDTERASLRGAAGERSPARGVLSDERMTNIPTDRLVTVTGGSAQPHLVQKPVGNGVRLLAPKWKNNDPWRSEPMFGQ